MFWRKKPTPPPATAPAPVRAQPRRDEYKATWTGLSQTKEQASIHVTGSVDEDRLRATAAATYKILEDTVGIKSDDVILEIGCGIGRVGQVLSPRCSRWIGCDVLR